MYLYLITFGDGSQIHVRASSPKEANDRASIIGIVSHIKWMR
jgi:hypothetical protein